MTEDMLSHLKRSEKGLKFKVGISFYGYPFVIEMPSSHEKYWRECGGFAGEWFNQDDMPKEPGIYDMIFDYKEIDYDNDTGYEYTFVSLNKILGVEQ